MTGNVLLYSEIIENQEAVDYVVSKYFPDAPKEGAGCSASQRIYSPIYRKPEHGKITLKPEYPPITTGSRNLSLTSLAGQLHNQGYSKADIYKELFVFFSCWTWVVQFQHLCFDRIFVPLTF